MRKDSLAGLLAVCFVAAPLSPALAQHCYSGWTAAYSCMEGCGGCPANGGARRGWSRAPAPPPGPSPAEIARRQRLAVSREDNDQGIAAYARGDWAEAVRLFQLSLDNDPGDEVISHNLSGAQAKLSEAQQSVIAAGRIRSLVEGYAQSVAPLSASSGLDFDQGSSASRASGGLEFMTTPAAPAARPAAGDCGSAPDFGPSVVNACHVPSGLPKTVEDEIPHTPAGDLVRKGFEAIAEHDWQVAVAWFGEAHAREPGNAGIARLVDLARYTETRETGSPGAAPAPGSRRGVPDDAAINAEMDRQMAESELHGAAPAPGSRRGGVDGAAINAEMDRQMAESELRGAAHPGVAAGQSAQLNALIDEGMNRDLARDLAAYDRSHAASLAAPASEAPPNWRAFFGALFEPARINRRPASVAGVRD